MDQAVDIEESVQVGLPSHMLAREFTTADLTELTKKPPHASVLVPG